MVSIFPAGRHLHQMGITNFVEDAQQDAEFTNEMIQVAAASKQKDDYGLDVITLLRDLSSGIIDISPDSYDNLSGPERDVISKWIQQLAQAERMAKDINSMLSTRRSKGNRSNRRR